MDSNREPLKPFNYDEEKFSKQEVPEVDEIVLNQEQSKDFDVEDYTKLLSRKQRRDIIKSSQREFAKTQFNFTKWVASLNAEQISCYKDSYVSFANSPFPKPELTLIMRGLNVFNKNTKQWSDWQIETFEKFEKKLLEKK